MLLQECEELRGESLLLITCIPLEECSPICIAKVMEGQSPLSHSNSSGEDLVALLVHIDLGQEGMMV